MNVEEQSPPEWVLRTKGLVLASGAKKPDLQIGQGLSLVHSKRESSATAFAMTLAGRMKPQQGDIYLADISEDTPATNRQRFDSIAFAGVIQIDALERQVPLRSVIREQAAWNGPWWGRVPRDLDQIESYVTAREEVGLEFEEAELRKMSIGDLDPLTRFKLRLVLALMARPQASMLIVDDIDQVASMELRDAILECLLHISQDLPVLAISANPDNKDFADTVIYLHDDVADVTRSSGDQEVVL